MLGEPIEIVVLGASATVLPARLLWRADEAVGIQVHPTLPPGTPICIRDAGGDGWMHGCVEGGGDVLRVSVRGAQPRDRREFSRAWGAIRLRWSVGTNEELDAWMTGGDVSGPFSTPDPFMDFSGSGLKFHDSVTPRPGEMLMLELAVARDSRMHRATARVIRVTPIPDDERDERPFAPGATIPTHAIAVHFGDIAPGTTEALASFGERIAEAML